MSGGRGGALPGLPPPLQLDVGVHWNNYQEHMLAACKHVLCLLHASRVARTNVSVGIPGPGKALQKRLSYRLCSRVAPVPLCKPSALAKHSTNICSSDSPCMAHRRPMQGEPLGKHSRNVCPVDFPRMWHRSLKQGECPREALQEHLF